MVVALGFGRGDGEADRYHVEKRRIGDAGEVIPDGELKLIGSDPQRSAAEQGGVGATIGIGQRGDDQGARARADLRVPPGCRPPGRHGHCRGHGSRGVLGPRFARSVDRGHQPQPRNQADLVDCVGELGVLLISDAALELAQDGFAGAATDADDERKAEFLPVEPVELVELLEFLIRQAIEPEVSLFVAGGLGETRRSPSLLPSSGWACRKASFRSAGRSDRLHHRGVQGGDGRERAARRGGLGNPGECSKISPSAATKASEAQVLR